MKWYNVNDRVPADQQEVLVRKKGVVSLAKFDRNTRQFNLREGSSLSVEGSQIEWMELVPPGKTT